MIHRLIRKINGLTVKQRMRAGFGMILVVLAIVAMQTLYSLLAIKKDTENVVENYQPTVITTMRLAEQIKDALVGLGFYLLSTEESHKEDYLNRIQEADALLAHLKDQPVIKSDEQAAQLVAAIEQDVEQFKALQDTMFTLAVRPDKNFPAMSYSQENINPLSQAILQNINIMIASEEEQAERAQRLPLIRTLNNMRFSWARLMSGVRAYLGFHSGVALDEVRDQKNLFQRQLGEIKERYGESFSLEQEGAAEELDQLQRDSHLPDHGRRPARGGEPAARRHR